MVRFFASYTLRAIHSRSWGFLKESLASGGRGPWEEGALACSATHSSRWQVTAAMCPNGPQTHTSRMHAKLQRRVRSFFLATGT